MRDDSGAAFGLCLFSERGDLRPESSSGEPTIDVTISYVPEIEKSKFE